MTEVALLPIEERRELFRRAAAVDGGPRNPVMIEKDYWVCWMLGRLFGTSRADEVVPGLVFKGGTSLSKAYRAISRFSEDIDLTLPRAALGLAAGDDLTPGLSVTKAQRKLEAMSDRCCEYVARPLRDTLRERVAAGLAGAEHNQPWALDVAAADATTLTFAFPVALEAGEYGAAAYVVPAIRLEFGIKNEPWPAHDAEIAPYVNAVAPRDLQTMPIRVRVLDGERTFWEKATILHLEAHRPQVRKGSDRLSRHYADLATLFEQDIGRQALDRLELLRHVARHKAMYFRTPWARYDDAAAMRDMYFAPPLSFDEIRGRVRALERAVRERSAAMRW